MEDELILSIVMITVPDRKKQFEKLKKEVCRQIKYCREVHPTLGTVEIKEVKTKKFKEGGPSIGAKRQAGLNMSNGQYVCWLDDDDNISPDYVETILRLAISGSDVLVFNSFARFNTFWALVQMNLSFKNDTQMFPGIVHRRPYHICAFKRDLLKEVTFPDTNWDEDTGFIAQALLRCKTQAKTEAILHEYRRITKSLAWQSEQ